MKEFEKGKFYSCNDIENFAVENDFSINEHGSFSIGENFIVIRHNTRDLIASFVLIGLFGNNFECIYSDI